MELLFSKPGTNEHWNIRSWFQSASGIFCSQYSCFFERQRKPQPSWKRNQTNQTEKSWAPLKYAWVLISFHSHCQHPIINHYLFLSKLLQKSPSWSPCTCSYASLTSTPQVKWFFQKHNVILFHPLCGLPLLSDKPNSLMWASGRTWLGLAQLSFQLLTLAHRGPFPSQSLPTC